MRRAWPALLVAALGAAAYAGSLDVPFVFDDQAALVEDPSLHALGLGPEALSRAAAPFPAGRWLSRLTFAASHAASALDPWGWHLLNLAIHLAASLLVLRLGRRLLGRLGGLGPAAAERASLLAALLFAVHPVQVQAVTYLVQRSTSLGAALGLGALLLFLAGLEAAGPGRSWRLGGAAALAFLAFGAKESLAVLPALALLLARLTRPDLGAALRRRWPLALGATAAVAALVGLAAWPYAEVMARDQARLGVPVGLRLLSQPRALWQELSLLAFPWPGRLRLDPAFAASRSLVEPATTLPALLGLAGLAWAAVALRRRVPLVTLAVGWFLASLLVEQTVLPLDLVAEHRLYLAGIGFLLLAGFGLERWRGARPWGPWPAAAPLVALLLAGTVARNQAWHDPEALLSAPGSNPRGLLTVGAARAARGDAAGAGEAFRRVLEAEPGNEEARYDLAALALATGDLRGAEAQLRALTTDHPGLEPAWVSLGWTLHLAGQADEAEVATRRALALHPADAGARINLSMMRLVRGDRTGARAELLAAVAADPGAGLAWGNLARLDLQDGQVTTAVARAQRFVDLASDQAEPWAVLGQALAAGGDRAGAEQAFREALRREPSNGEARQGLQRLGR